MERPSRTEIKRVVGREKNANKLGHLSLHNYIPLCVGLPFFYESIYAM